MRLRRRNPKFQGQGQTRPDLSTEEIEALRLQISQIQEQVNVISLVRAQLGARSFSGLRTLGIILYFLFLPLEWLKPLLALLFLPFRLIRRLWRLLKKPLFYWTGFYWFCFIWVLILDGGLKEVLISLRHPRRLARSIGLLQQ